MKLLFEDELAPITSEIAFVEAKLEAAVDGFCDWQKRLAEPLGLRPTKKATSGSLREVVLALLPLTAPRPLKWLFIPTESQWVAVLENSPGGTDAGTLASVLSQQLKSRALRVAAVPDTKTGKRNQGRYGLCVLEVFGPGGQPRGHLRSIAVVNDGGRWSFSAFGAPLPFEDLEKYESRRIVDRFTFDDLRSYTAALGLRPFDQDFYEPGEAVLIDLVGGRLKGVKEYSLEDARAGF